MLIYTPYFTRVQVLYFCMCHRYAARSLAYECSWLWCTWSGISLPDKCWYSFFSSFACRRFCSLICVWRYYFSLYGSWFFYYVLCVMGNTALLTNNARQSYWFLVFFRWFSCTPYLVPINVSNNWDTKTVNPQIWDWVVLKNLFWRTDQNSPSSSLYLSYPAS